jgi:hypothetical protein
VSDGVGNLPVSQQERRRGTGMRDQALHEARASRCCQRHDRERATREGDARFARRTCCEATSAAAIACLDPDVLVTGGTKAGVELYVGARQVTDLVARGV